MPEPDPWRELRAELVTHDNETFKEAMSRLERERPETPAHKWKRESRNG